jgi:ATP-dependent Clp protease ATP-binding subunit ClpA
MNEQSSTFTDGARRALTLAQEEAARLNHSDIGTAHLLLGLVREQDGVAARLLAQAGVEVERARSALESVHARANRPPTGETGLTERAKTVIGYSVYEAQRLGHHQLDTEHLLLVLLERGSDGAIDVLTILGVDLAQLREALAEALSRYLEPEPTEVGATERGAANAWSAGPDHARSDKFTDSARRVLTLAQEEAVRLNHNYIGTEHLLLGLIRLQDCGAAKVLTNLGVDLNRARSAMEFIAGRGDRPIVGEVGLTPRAKHVIELAVDEARRLSHRGISTEHLLLGLVREGEGIAAGVLESLAVSLERARRQAMQQLGQEGLEAAVESRAWPPSVPTEASTLLGPDEQAQVCAQCAARNPFYFRYCFNCGALLTPA